MSKYAGFPEQAPMRPNRLTKITSVPTTMSDTQSPMIDPTRSYPMAQTERIQVSINEGYILQF